MKPKSLLLHKCIGAVLLILCMFPVVTNSYAQDKSVLGSVKDENGLPVPGVNVVEKGTIHGSITDQHGKYSLHVESDPVVITSYSTLQHTVTGRVTSEEDGSGIPGVSILIKGTTQGTATDVDGNYKLNAPSEDAVLVFSSIGYLQQEITVGTQSVINVVLAPDIIKLEEVVVIGYGTVKKSDLTGSVSQVSNENFNKGIYASIDQAVIGRAAGVQIRQTSGEPGGGMSTRIRGASSINASNEPLYVIDGLPIDNNPTLSIGGGAGTDSNPNPKNPLNSLNPNDIESIEILKDASATAIYGSRGANGVILITTKKGTKGQMKVNFDTYVGVQNLTKKYDILNTREYIEAINAISIDKGDGPVFNADDIASIGTGTDWQDEIFRSANVQNHSLSFNGGTDNVSYYISCNYFNQQGLVENSGMKKYTLKTNLVSNINDRFSINLNLNSSLVSDEAAVEGLTHNENGGVIYSAVFYDPTWPIKDENGNYIQSTDLLLPNPVTIYKGIENDVQTIRMFGNIALNYQITDELSTKLNFGSDLQNARRDIYNSRITFQGKANNGLAFINSLNRSNILAEYTLSYLKTISENHVITALAGVTYQDFIDKTYSSGISNFPTDILSTNNLAFGNADQAFVNSQKEGYTLLSYLGRINYSILNKFLLTGSFRVDGSSRFGENNKFGYFPSFAFAWKLHEENFIPELLSELKLRTSWGLTGNQEIENYNSLSTYTSVGSAVFNGQQQTAAGPSRLANPDLKWETTEQYNIGIDVGFFDGRLSGSVDYFIKNTRDILINLPLPLSSGYDDKLTNVGKMRNNGIETIINSKNIAGRDFEWNTILNFSAIKNEAVDISEDLTMILMGNAPEAAGNSTIVKPGLPINSYYGFMITGIFQTQEEVDNSAQPNSKPGFPIFDDTNGDGTINSNDKVVLGDPFPDFTFGISNTFKYKNFGLDIIFNGQYGNELLNATAIGLMYPSNFRRNRSREQINDRWTTQNPDAKWPSQTDPSSYGGGRVNNLVVEDASYIRLQSLQLSYVLPTKNIDFINMVRINITGQNLFTITNYTGFNPDANVYGRNNYQIGFMEYPVAKIWTVGLNVIF